MELTDLLAILQGEPKKPSVIKNVPVAGKRTIEVPTKFEVEDKTFKPMDFTKKYRK